MPNRTGPNIYSDIYTDTNPENIIAAKKGALFFRRNNSFYLNPSGDSGGAWQQLPYKTVIIPRPPTNRLIQFKEPYQVWEKTTDGYLDEFREVLPKTGWEFYSNEDMFFKEQPRPFNWSFHPGSSTPTPTSSYDPSGEQWDKGYDENFYYMKSGSYWYRAPITLFSFVGEDIGEQPNLYDNPPFVVAPRSLPLPSSSFVPDKVVFGDQTYSRDFYYIKPSAKWKRSSLDIFNTSNMTRF